MFTLLNILFILFSVASAAYFYYKRCYSYWSDRSVPFVEPVFPVGSINRTEFFGLQFAKFYAEVKNGKWPLLGMYFVLKPAALITDLKLTQKVLVTDFNHFQDRGHYYNAKDDPLSANLVNLEMHKWKPLRQKLTPTFSSGRMKHMFPTIIDVGHRFIDCLSNDMKHTNEFDMRDWLGRFLTDVIGTCAFGIEANSLANPDTAFREMGKKFFDQPKISFFSRAITGSYKNLARFLKIKIIHPDVTEFFMNIVEQTIDHREKNNIRRRDFMDMMIQLKNRGSLKEDVHDPAGRLTVNEIAGSAFIFYLGGFGMSSTTLTYTFYELAQPHNRHIQDRVRDEVNNALEKYDGELTYESLSEMRYSEQVINETLRKYPPTPNLIRIVTKDYECADTKVVLPKGMSIVIPIYGFHHDPDIYPEPEEFRPERFTPEEIGKRPSGSFMPFGEGPRSCIALRFGMLQARIGLAMLVKNFKFSTCDRTTPMPLTYQLEGIQLIPKEKIWLNVQPI